MRKAAALFLLFVSLGLVFAGAASAQEVDTAVINEDGTPVDVTSPGDEVALQVNASANESYLLDPAVLITVDPETGLTFEPDKAVMFFDGVEYANDPNDPNGPFFYWDEINQSWVWWIGWVYGDMFPGETAQLIAPAIVTDTGEITVFADFYEWPAEAPEPILLDSDSFTFLSEAAPEATPGTVPMQTTGTPVALAALGLLGIIGGAVYGRLR